MDLVLLIVFPIVATFLTLFLKLNFLVSTFLFFGAPAIYLSWKNPKIIKKSLTFSLIAMFGIAILMSHMAFMDESWFTPSFWRVMGGSVSIDEVIWGLLWAYFGVAFWEYFLDHDKNKIKFSPNIRYLIILLGVVMTAFFSLYFAQSPYLAQPYFYIKFGLIIAIPLVFAILRFPKLVRKLVAVGTYFFLVSILFEFVALKTNLWFFAGKNYIGTTLLAGQTLPLEELIFWIILGVPGLICWYEFFADDGK